MVVVRTRNINNYINSNKNYDNKNTNENNICNCIATTSNLKNFYGTGSCKSICKCKSNNQIFANFSLNLLPGKK